MFTPKKEIDYLEIASEISEWFERNYGYFVNKNSDKIKIIQDFAGQLERLPVGVMSYIQQTKNHFIDSGIKHPPVPPVFIRELRAIWYAKKPQPQTQTQPVYIDKIKFIAEKIYNIKGDENRIRFIKMLHSKKELNLKTKSIASMEIEKVLKRNNFTENEIREITGLK